MEGKSYDQVGGVSRQWRMAPFWDRGNQLTDRFDNKSQYISSHQRARYGEW